MTLKNFNNILFSCVLRATASTARYCWDAY